MRRTNRKSLPGKVGANGSAQQHHQPEASATIEGVRPVTRDDLDALGELRSELQFAAHFYKEDLKERWDNAERHWHELQQKLKSVENAASVSRIEIGFAISILVTSLHDAYLELRRAVVQSQTKETTT
ncbi:hypothetical protein [Hydrocarboniphaga sp.]|uniref:hypothetical protein n=1 Tax=Hydrocarboniphaga sp. TaxID=2033016 RepID=UPI003D151214